MPVGQPCHVSDPIGADSVPVGRVLPDHGDRSDHRDQSGDRSGRISAGRRRGRGS